MGGSKKGEHRGNARKRPDRPITDIEGALKELRRGRKNNRVRRTGRSKSHETVGEIMDEAVSQRGPGGGLEYAGIDRRITVSRIIVGNTDAIEDITPKQAMLMGMRHSLQAIRDLTDMLDYISKLPPTAEMTRQANMLEAEIERQYTVMRDFARDVAGYIHPKLQATSVMTNMGASEASLLQQMLDEVNELESNAPIPIEHKPSKMGGG